MSGKRQPEEFPLYKVATLALCPSNAEFNDKDIQNLVSVILNIPKGMTLSATQLSRSIEICQRALNQSMSSEFDKIRSEYIFLKKDWVNVNREIKVFVGSYNRIPKGYLEFIGINIPVNS